MKIERKKNLPHARILAKKLAAEEAEFHSSLPSCLQKVLDGKNSFCGGICSRSITMMIQEWLTS